MTDDTPMPSDEVRGRVRNVLFSDDAAELIATSGLRETKWHWDRLVDELIRAAQPQTGPEIPDWVKSWHVVPNGEHGPGFTVYTNLDTSGDDHTFDTWGYHPTDPMRALQAAIAATGEGE